MRQRSEQIYGQLCRVIPGGVNSPARSFKGLEMTPLVVSEAKGSRIVDADGNSYIDFCNCWGALIHGHAPDFLVSDIQQQMTKGSAYGMATEHEERLANLIVRNVPGIEKVRFMNSGTEAVMTAIRMARRYTGKELTVKFQGNYHGHFDPGLEKTLPFNDPEAFRSFMKAHEEEVAAVIVEAIPANMGVVLPRPEFLDAIKESKAFLIVDEVVTGFRLAIEGGAALLGLKADLLTFGKIIGGGFPVGAVGGKKEIMDTLSPAGGVFQAGTFAGNPITMRAGIAALEKLMEKDFYEELDRKSSRFLQKIRSPHVSSIGSMFTVVFDNVETFRPFFQHLFEKGILFAPSPFEANFISTAHSEEELDYVADVINEFIR